MECFILKFTLFKTHRTYIPYNSSKRLCSIHHKIHVYQLLEITTSGPGTMYVTDAEVKTYPGIVSM